VVIFEASRSGTLATSKVPEVTFVVGSSGMRSRPAVPRVNLEMSSPDAASLESVTAPSAMSWLPMVRSLMWTERTMPGPIPPNPIPSPP